MCLARFLFSSAGKEESVSERKSRSQERKSRSQRVRNSQEVCHRRRSLTRTGTRVVGKQVAQHVGMIESQSFRLSLGHVDPLRAGSIVGGAESGRIWHFDSGQNADDMSAWLWRARERASG